MEHINCFDAVSAMVDTVAHKKGIVISAETMDRVASICNMVNEFADTIDLNNLDVGADMDHDVLMISIFCDEIIFENGRNNAFCKLITGVDSFSVTKSDTDEMQLDLYVTNIWGV